MRTYIHRVAPVHADGTTTATSPLAQQDDMLKMGSPSQLAAPLTLPDLVPGDRVTIHIIRGAAIPFYTVNDNKTNDQAINFPVLADFNVGRYND